MLLGTLSSVLALTDPHELQHTLCTRMAIAKALGLTHTSMTSTSQTSILWALQSLQPPTQAHRWQHTPIEAPTPGLPARRLEVACRDKITAELPSHAPSVRVLCQPSNCRGPEICS